MRQHISIFPVYFKSNFRAKKSNEMYPRKMDPDVIEAKRAMKEERRYVDLSLSRIT